MDQLSISRPNFNRYSPEIKKQILRVILITLIALTLVHLVAYPRLPFSTNYQFPITPFLVIFFCGTAMCTTNYVVIRRLDKLLEKQTSVRNRFLTEFLIVFVTTGVTYTATYLLVFKLYFGAVLNWVHYTRFLVLCEGIMIFEYVLLKALVGHQFTMAINPGKIGIKTRKESLAIDQSNIVLFHSSNGVVSVQIKDGKKVITQFTSLEEVENKVSDFIFFRVNRQYLVNREMIGGFKKQKNRKLTLNLDSNYSYGSDVNITISRYKSQQFKEWWNVEQSADSISQRYVDAKMLN